MSIFFELHKDIPREGPGNRASTRKAFETLGLPDSLRILDIGCGPGDQTLELAHLCPASSIVAVDTQESFLRDLERRALQEGVTADVQTVQASMFDLGFEEESFDLIWSEGAIYIMGFGEGIAAWRRFLKPGGYMVVSEISWLVEHPADEAVAFWQSDYPGMKSVTENAALVKARGYELVETFVLPEEGWWEDYYHPLEARVKQLRQVYEGNQEAMAVLNSTQLEIDLYRKYSSDYGYVFYIMKKTDEAN